MNKEMQPPQQWSADENEVRSLYNQLLQGWNERDAEEMAAPFAEDGELIGFDGSHCLGREDIISHLKPIFANHPTAAFVAKVRTVRFLGSKAAIVRAVAGMVPRGQSDINPAVNTHHTVIAVKLEQGWRISLFQNTPAQFHGRPDLVERLTEELRQLL